MARSGVRKKDTKLATGLTMLVFGILFLLEKVGFFSLFPKAVHHIVMDWRNFFFYAGIIFLFTKNDKLIGCLLILLGLIFHFRSYINTLTGMGDFLWPVLLIVTGTLFIYLAVKR
ncbi:MAG: hypothetical protein LUG18_00895 [Candidatus Azobacteroides sp.]|nr:hypothetical protein [Candidatus Azobacteroides sp.]